MIKDYIEFQKIFFSIYKSVRKIKIGTIIFLNFKNSLSIFSLYIGEVKLKKVPTFLKKIFYSKNKGTKKVDFDVL